MPGSEERYKMTKWDHPEDSLVGGPTCSSLEAAAEAAAKVNAMLIAKGKLKPSQLSNVQQAKQKNPQTQSNMELAEVEINDVPISCRNLLTRGSTQDEISKMSGAAVSTRGRYMSPDDRIHCGPGDRPLYLCVQGPSQDCVDKAVARIREIIATSYRSKGGKISPRAPGAAPTTLRPRLSVMEGSGIIPTPPPLMSLNTQPTIPMVQEKIFIGLEHAPPNFDVKNKLLGPMGSFLQHIQAETGSKVTLHGKGSGFIEPNTGREAFEPMYILVQHPTLLGVQNAKQLASNLVQTVQQEYAQFQQALAAMPTTYAPGTTPILAGIQPQTGPPPPSGSTWSLAQPPPGVPAVSIGSALPAPVPTLGQPHPVAMSIPAPVPVGEVQPVLSGAFSQSLPQTVLVNTSVPPPNYGPPPSTSAPHPLPIGSSVAIGQMSSTIALSQPPNPMLQPVPNQQLGMAPSVAAPPITLHVSQPQASMGHPVPAGSIVSVTSLQPQVAQPGLVQVPTVPQGPPPGCVSHTGPAPQAILTQPPPGVVPTAVVQAVQHLPTVAQLSQPGQLLPQQPQPPQPQPQPSQGSMAQPLVTLAPHSLHQPPPQVSVGQPLPQQQPQQQPQQPVPQQQPQSQALSMASEPPHANSLTGPSGQTYYKQYLHTSSVEEAPTTTTLRSVKEDRPHKRRFTEEKKEDKLPENLLGYQHGPPHLTGLVRSQAQDQTSTSKAYGTLGIQEGLKDRPESDPNKRALMPPPPPPLGAASSQDKQLLPPPLPPFGLIGNDGPIQKKMKGALGNVSVIQENTDKSDENDTQQTRVTAQEPGQYVQETPHLITHEANIRQSELEKPRPVLNVEERVYSSSASEDPPVVGLVRSSQAFSGPTANVTSVKSSVSSLVMTHQPPGGNTSRYDFSPVVSAQSGYVLSTSLAVSSSSQSQSSAIIATTHVREPPPMEVSKPVTPNLVLPLATSVAEAPPPQFSTAPGIPPPYSAHYSSPPQTPSLSEPHYVLSHSVAPSHHLQPHHSAAPSLNPPPAGPQHSTGHTVTPSGFPQAQSAGLVQHLPMPPEPNQFAQDTNTFGHASTLFAGPPPRNGETQTFTQVPTTAREPSLDRPATHMGNGPPPPDPRSQGRPPYGLYSPGFGPPSSRGQTTYW